MQDPALPSHRSGSTEGVGFRELRYFITVAEAHQISLAAQRLFMTQPALSQAVRRLERQLGCALFRRHPGGVDLTDAGAAVLPEARAALAAVERVIAVAGRSTQPRP